MTVLVAVSPEETNAQLVLAGAMCARTLNNDLVLGAVIPAPRPDDRFEHREYQAFLEKQALETLERHKEYLPADVRVRTRVHVSRSIPTGIVELAEMLSANSIVAGSAHSGMLGRISLGSTTDHLLHSSPVAIVLIPRGARIAKDARITRATVAYSGDRDKAIALGVGALAGRLHSRLRLARFSVHRTLPIQQFLRVGAGSEPEREWSKDAIEDMQPLVESLSSIHRPPVMCVEAVRGESWEEAIDDLDWEAGDILVVGSSGGGLAGQVFLGSKASKIVRTSPVPVMVVPAQVAEELADEDSD